MLRRGKAPSLHETSVPLQRDSPAQGSLELEQMPMTLCVIPGIELASFLKSLDAYCPEDLMYTSLHVVWVGKPNHGGG